MHTTRGFKQIIVLIAVTLAQSKNQENREHRGGSMNMRSIILLTRYDLVGTSLTWQEDKAKVDSATILWQL